MLSSLVLASTLAFAAAPSGSWVVLIKTDGSVPASWSDNLQDAVKSATSSKSGVRWVPPPQVSLADAQLALGCSAWDASCVGQIAGMMNADVALLLEIEKRGKGAWMHRQLVSKSGKARGKRERFELPDRSAKGLQVARAIAASTVTGKAVTIVTLTTDVEGADVFVDGDKVGETPLTLTSELSVGGHTVEFRMAGRAPVTQKVNVKAGEVTKVGAVMATAAMPPPNDPEVGNPVDNQVQEDPLPAVNQPDDPPPGAAGGGLDPLFGYATLGVAGAVALVGAGLYGGHAFVAVDSAARPCTNPADLELPQSQRDCESQAEAYERLQTEGPQIQQTMDALYWSFIAAEVAAGVLAVAGIGLVVFSFVTAEE